MKKTIVTLLLLCTTSAVFADQGRRDGRDDRRNDPMRDLRECQISLDISRRDNQSLNDKLFNCQSNRGNVDQLQRENADLRLQVENGRNMIRDQRDQIERLKIDIARLEMEAHPDRGGRFDLSASILACSRINNTVYAQQCIQLAKSNSIQANIIDQCSKYSNTYYAIECVKTASTKNVSAKQIEACQEIKNEVYSQQCISLASDKQLRIDLIRSCVQSSTNTYYQLECIKTI